MSIYAPSHFGKNNVYILVVPGERVHTTSYVLLWYVVWRSRRINMGLVLVPYANASDVVMGRVDHKPHYATIHK